MDIQKAIEAILFSAEKPITLKELETIFQHPSLAQLQIQKSDLENYLKQIELKYQNDEYPVILKIVNNGYQLFTKPDYYEVVRIATLYKEKKRISKSALETLSIIAYKQPITKAEIEHIRGVNSDYAVQKLLEFQLIEIAGRSDLPGKPLLYRTSDSFFEYFKINSLNDLPKLNELNENDEADINPFKNPINPSEIPLN